MGEFAFIVIIGLISVIGFFLFWGTVIFIIVRIFRSSSGLTGQQKVGLAAGLLHFLSRGGGRSTDLMDSSAGGVAAENGIDLNDRGF